MQKELALDLSAKVSARIRFRFDDRSNEMPDQKALYLMGHLLSWADG